MASPSAATSARISSWSMRCLLEGNVTADECLITMTTHPRYGSVLLEFDTRMRFKVLSETALPGNRGMRVSTQMLRAGSKTPIPVDYLVRNVGGQWKVFDVMVEGISYVQAFKNQFAAALNQKSIREVTADLRAGHLNAGNGKGGNGKGGSR